MAANNYISVVDKAMRVLETMRGKREAPLGEIASSSGLIKSAAFRILFTLEHLGYVQKHEGGRYSLTERIHRLASDDGATADLGNLVVPFMAELVRRFKETVNVGVLEDGEVLYIRVLECAHVFRLAAHAGMRSPVHSTALGKCLLCRLPRQEVDTIFKKHPLRPTTTKTIRSRAAFYQELERVRSRGYAIDNQEDSSGARCLAAPILTSAGDVLAAISISGPAARVTPRRDREISTALIESCEKIAKLLGYAGNSTKGPGTGA